LSKFEELAVVDLAARNGLRIAVSHEVGRLCRGRACGLGGRQDVSLLWA
jgi:hypothetical protein